MAQTKIAVWGLLAGAVLLIVAALVGIAKGNNGSAVYLGLGAAFLGIAVVFVALLAVRAQKPPSDPPPPAA